MTNKEKIIDALSKVDCYGILGLIDEMDKGGFFTAPCSGQFHLSKEGGLAEHSLNVMNLMFRLDHDLDAGIPERSIVLCGLLHDLGKMGDYGKPNYTPNILKSGKQSDSKPFETNKDLLYIDHAIRSVVIAERYIKLTEEEEHAIIYHNGKYTHLGYDLKETPLMLILHFADMWASRVVEIENEKEGE